MKKGLMLSTPSLKTVFWGGVSELPKDSSAACTAVGRTEGLLRVTRGPSQPLLILKCLSHGRTVGKIQKLKWDAILKYSSLSSPLLEKYYMRKLIQL